MEIRYRVTGDSRNVSDEIGRTLIARGLASCVDAPKPEQQVEPAKVSTRTSKPKRHYKRRDLRAEG